MKGYAQYEEDIWLLEHYPYLKFPGFFLDIGASDGILLNNTYLFEQLGWNGIVIEPRKAVFKSLKRNRKCKKYNYYIHNKKEKQIFQEIIGEAELLSGLLNFSAMQRVIREVLETNSKIKLHKIKTYPIQNIIKKCPFQIDILSIDTEGNELEILKGINFRETFISFIIVENNNVFNHHTKIYLLSQGYKFLIRLGCNEIYKKNTDI